MPGTVSPLATCELSAELRRAAERVGTPCYVYFADRIVARIHELTDAFGGRFALSYAVKANPNRQLLRALEPHLPWLDVSSAGELETGLTCGYDASRLSFSGPGKTRYELSRAVDAHCGQIVVESLAEARELDQLARMRGKPANILLRINPLHVPRGFGVNMAGRPSQFGVDEEQLDSALADIQRLKGLSLAGFHIYAGSQCLDAGSIAENLTGYIDIFAQAAEACDRPPRHLVFGAGIGIAYSEGQQAVNLAEVAERVNPAFDRMRHNPRLAEAACALELGRYLVGEAGYFLTRIVRRKTSRNKHIGVCDGGMNHHLAASGHFGSVIHRNYPIFKVSLDDDPGVEAPRHETYDLYGPLCTTIDVLARDIRLPCLEEGDLLAIACSGAYGLTASPVHFISHRLPREVLVKDTLQLTNHAKHRQPT
jgi:diaminopimelate decarboxylase